jgi:hypothetical protein
MVRKLSLKWKNYFEKGMFVCNRVVGHEPKTARYAKILVEDITETPPKDLWIIDSRW